jgi:anti-sigma regulatory factor (Ser/Thr protein kinase)
VTPDRITLTLPPEREFQRVAHLVLGGLAVRLNLTLEALEDLQLALDGLLDTGSPEEEEVTLELSVVGGAIEATVGPFRARSVQHALEAESDGVGLRRVLDTVVDRVEVDEREGGDWVQLTKRIDEQKRNGAA